MLNDRERQALCTVAEVLVEIRKLARRDGNHTAIAALADAVHNTPRLIAEGDPAMAWLVDSEQERAAALLRATA